MALQLEDRMKLVRLLGMLGSTYDGERANAAALADRFVRDKGSTWAEVVVPHLAAPRPPPPPPPQPPPPPPPPRRAWRDVLDDVSKMEGYLSEWERGFMRTLSNWRGAPSSKQEAVLRGIAERFNIAWI